MVPVLSLSEKLEKDLGLGGSVLSFSMEAGHCNEAGHFWSWRRTQRQRHAALPFSRGITATKEEQKT